MRYGKSYNATIAALTVIALAGCQTAGPNSIGIGRDRYNNIIQSTSMEQTMSNIVRVYNHEPTLFIDVTEVDSTLSFGGSLTGAATNIGARTGTSGGTLAGQVGSTGATIQYSETPTVRYQPLLGQPLVAQLVTPVSVDALGLLYDSYWDVAPLLDFSAAYLTLDYHQFYLALNTLEELRSREALELVAGRSTLLNTLQADTVSSVTPKANTTSSNPSDSSKARNANNNDSLIVYLRPFHPYGRHADLVVNERIMQLWVRLLRLYGDSQPNSVPPQQCAGIGLSLSKGALKGWDVDIEHQLTGSEDSDKSAQLERARNCLPGAIEIRVVPLPGLAPQGSDTAKALFNNANRAPMMRTYSALGILKNATERPGPKIEFVTPQMYRTIHDDPWNAGVRKSSYYTLLPSELDSIDCPETQKQGGGCDNPLAPDQAKQVGAEIEKWIRASANMGIANDAGATDENYLNGIDVYEKPGDDIFAPEYVDFNGLLGTLRRYILVVVDNHLPDEPVYVSYTDGQRWYYIMKEDEVSQRNFQLVSLFMTMMAVPPSTQPLSPVINVGD